MTRRKYKRSKVWIIYNSMTKNVDEAVPNKKWSGLFEKNHHWASIEVRSTYDG